jgi:hypothetical protein
MSSLMNHLRGGWEIIRGSLTGRRIMRANRRRAIRMRVFEAMERRDMMSSTPIEIGMNLDNVNDYIPTWMFTDVFQSSRSWIRHAGAIDGPFVTGKDQDASELVIQRILG